MPRNFPDRIYQQRRDLGDRIRVLRKGLPATQEKLAEMTGIDRRTLQRIERGISDPRYSDLLLIAEALDVPLAELVQE
ncbi:helix-turn-helix transcriptional regulator [Streptomyces sp. NPDC088270]|uniref:helix-turn-helix domain-containing protein n=1 Tax=unclassified Streptomyces TaxID=2593676 RepID=UPI0034323021